MYEWVEWERESETAEMHTHRGMIFLWNRSAFLLRFPGSKSSQVCIISQTPTQASRSHLSSRPCTWILLLQACHLRNLRSISASLPLFPQGHLRHVYLMKPVFFLLFFPASDHSSKAPTQPMQHFRWDTCVLLSLRNRRVSCYVTRAIYAAYQSDLQVNIQQLVCWHYSLLSFMCDLKVVQTNAQGGIIRELTFYMFE